MRDIDDKRNNLVDDKKNGMPNRNKLPDSKQPVPPGGNKWKRKNISLLLAVVLVATVLVQLLDSQNPVEEKNYSEFKKIIADTTLVIKAVELQRIGEGYVFVGERQLTPQEQAERKATHT